ncbi:DUF6065 family protein [Nonomuraea sp. NPDC049695]|uniref:DUF6065 family protein n=1 Tax=Nonomuraea sp. NPDC049695 TaxID=3154734 RepID=UPI003442CD27
MTNLDVKVEFFNLYPDVRPPMLASPDLRGSMEAKAARVCSPMTTASGFGWYVYPPADFAVRWDGYTSEWSLLENNEPVGWRSLAGAHDGTLPASQEILQKIPKDRSADMDIFDKYHGLPFIEADPRNPHMLEIVTGIIARTPPDWWLQVRAVPNWPQPGDHQILEGIIETDWYRSYLPTMVRLTQQNRVVRFYRHLPIMSLQPVSRRAVEAGRRPPGDYRGIEHIPDDVWREFVAWRRRKQDPNSAAFYVREQRERAKLRNRVTRH